MHFIWVKKPNSADIGLTPVNKTEHSGQASKGKF